ncbi:MAG: ATP synthase F1 subunit epsilon [Firmicutes bacterium]|nr:ATP synthase F1 subunit epsilon [Bacillota bacterium]
MSDKTFYLEVITPEKLKFKGDVNLLQVEGYDGQMGILANHAPMLSLLKIGEILIRVRNKEVHMAAGEGFLRVSKNKASVLVDFAQRPEDINIETARKNREEAEKILSAREKLQDIDIDLAKIKLLKALLELKVVKKI